MSSNGEIHKADGARLMASLRAEGARAVSYRAGDLVMDPAVDSPRVGIVCTATVTVWRLSPKGKQLATASLRTGDWFENVFPNPDHERTFVEADAGVNVAWLDGGETRKAEDLRWATWAANPEGETGDKLLGFVNDKLFPALKGMEIGPKVEGDTAEDAVERVVQPPAGA